MSSHTLWEDEDEKEIEMLREDLERYVFAKIYKRYLFSAGVLILLLIILCLVFLLCLQKMLQKINFSKRGWQSLYLLHHLIWISVKSFGILTSGMLQLMVEI